MSLIGLKFGFLTGINYNLVKNEDIDKMTDYNTALYDLTSTGNTYGARIDFKSEIRIWRLLLHPELVLNFNEVGYHIIDKHNASKDMDAKQWLLYLDAPVLIGIKVGPRLMAGPVWHYHLTNLLVDQGDNKTEFFGNLKKLTIGLQAGIGFDFDNMALDVRYESNGRFLQKESVSRVC